MVLTPEVKEELKKMSERLAEITEKVRDGNPDEESANTTVAFLIAYGERDEQKEGNNVEMHLSAAGDEDILCSVMEKAHTAIHQ